jgi:hypothetical protein
MATCVLALVGGGIYSYKSIYPHYKVKEIVKAYLKDPNSAEFRLIKINKGGESACGLVNAKNSMGGYTGDKQFIVQGDGNVVFAPEGETKQCVEPELPRMPSVSFSDPLAASLSLTRSMDQYKEDGAKYISCLEGQLAVLKTAKAFEDQYMSLCPDSEGK